MNKFFRRLVGTALLGVGFAAQAAVVPFILGAGPNTATVAGTGSSLNGVTVFDGAGGAYSQGFTAPGGATLDKIIWWGYRGEDPSAGAASDAFEVLINGSLQLGSVTSVVDGLLKKYTLDIVDAPLAAGPGTLSIFNNESDFAWFWQGTGNVAWDGVSTSFPVAYNLVGTVVTNTTPEPGSLALVALAGLGLLAARRAR